MLDNINGWTLEGGGLDVKCKAGNFLKLDPAVITIIIMTHCSVPNRPTSGTDITKPKEEYMRGGIFFA